MKNLRQLLFGRMAQNRPISHRQVANSAGGYVWTVDIWTRLDRFLVLGSEGGTYYIRPQTLTAENAQAVIGCLEQDGIRVVDRVVEISQSGRAPKNDPALFVLAMAAGLGDDVTRKAALDALPQVARTGTHLFHFLNFVEGFRGWGRGLRRGVGNWYTGKSAEKLAYQAIKYRQRDGWTHRDALRLAHPRAQNEQQQILFNWIAQGWPDVGDEPHSDQALVQVWAYERAKRAESVDEIIQLIQDYRLPWEAIPTQFLAQAEVWAALLPRLPLYATLRNLGRMTSNGLLADFSATTNIVVERITNAEALRKARVHPIAILSALLTYRSGQGFRGALAWNPVTAIVDALDTAFYQSFQNVEATGKRQLLALDVSGSMGMGWVANAPGLSPRVASAAMSLLTASVEKETAFIGFGGEIVPLGISARQRLDDVIATVSGIPFGRTDCALPMLWAAERRLPVDAFIVYTDSETWFGEIHPSQALEQYRQRMGIDAKMIVVGMTSNGFSIADPNDTGMLDVVGFDTATPRLMADFIRD